MAQDGYPLITNCDIADSVIDKMRQHYSDKLPLQDFAVVDATRMPFRDSSFDLVVDKATFDALACGSDTTVPLRLVQEMYRVAKEAVVIITSGTPEKRMPVFSQVTSTIESH
jgi:ubiquinone/menaquinone biosynthesis C-methylase UbiE